jgi:hypothetical protein
VYSWIRVFAPLDEEAAQQRAAKTNAPKQRMG